MRLPLCNLLESDILAWLYGNAWQHLLHTFGRNRISDGNPGADVTPPRSESSRSWSGGTELDVLSHAPLTSHVVARKG
jgi:hypothetical protein